MKRAIRSSAVTPGSNWRSQCFGLGDNFRLSGFPRPRFQVRSDAEFQIKQATIYLRSSWLTDAYFRQRLDLPVYWDLPEPLLSPSCHCTPFAADRSSRNSPNKIASLNGLSLQRIASLGCRRPRALHSRKGKNISTELRRP